MQYGVDAAFPFDVASARQMKGLGWTWLGMYVGGPRALSGNAWHQVDGVKYPVRDLADSFKGFLPIYVGRNVGDNPSEPWDHIEMFSFDQGAQDGEEADRFTGACGFNSTTPLVLDIEYNTYEAHPEATEAYVAGWVSQVNGAGHPAGIYADRATVTALGHPDLVDFVWCAYWKTRATGLTQAPIGDFDPSWPPPWDAWQFGGSRIGGVSVDLNSASDSLLLATYG